MKKKTKLYTVTYGERVLSHANLEKVSKKIDPHHDHAYAESSCDEDDICCDDLDVVADLGEPNRDSQLRGSDSQSECLSEKNSNNYSGESDYTDSMNGTNTGSNTDSDDDEEMALLQQSLQPQN